MLDADAILTRLRAVLEAATGTLRTIAADRFNGGLYPGLSADGQSKLALVRPVAEASIISVAPHPNSPMSYHSMALYLLELEILVVRHLNFEHAVIDSVRDDIKALAANDADVIAQAVQYLGNIDSATTGIVSGRLMWTGSDVGDLQLEDDSPGLIESRHTFTAVAQVTQPTS